MKKLLVNFKGHWPHVVLGPLFKLAEAVLELFIPLVMADIIDKGILLADRQYVMQRGGLILALAAVCLVCGMTCQYFAAVAAQGFARNLRGQLFRHVFTLSPAECGAVGTDSLITRLTSDVNQVQTGVNMFIRLATRAPFLTIGSVVMALTINWKIGLIFLVVTPLIALVLYGIMSRSLPFYSHIQAGQDKISRLAGENLAGVRVIRAFDRQDSEVQAFDAAGDDLAALTVRVGKLSALLSPITTLLVDAGIVAIVWKGAQFADVGVLEQGQIIALVSYMTQALLAMIVLANLIVIFTKAIASAKRVAAVLDLEPSIADAPSVQETDGIPAGVPGAPRIAFEDVSFAYPGAGEPAVEHISFSVQPGQTLGIIGGTGCGKTTLVRLLTRDYDVTSGAVRMDGTDVREMPLLALRARIGVVFQAARLFSGTVRSNLLMANEHATDAQLWKALETAQGAAFVRAKPDGLDARVEEGGKNLSGGQKQRLTIARALVREPEVLILDDAASALDYATDAALRRALRTDTQGMTVVMISQRASTLQHADCILVLDDGAQCGFGPHAALLRTCPVYQEICKSQGLWEPKEGGDAQ